MTKEAFLLSRMTRKLQTMFIIRMMEALLGAYLAQVGSSSAKKVICRETLDLGVTVRVLVLTTIPDSTSQK